MGENMLYKFFRDLIVGSIIVFCVVSGSTSYAEISPVMDTAASQVTYVNINSADLATLQKIKGMSKRKHRLLSIIGQNMDHLNL
jgi:hypothetical protein